MDTKKSGKIIVYRETQKGPAWVWFVAGIFFIIATAMIGFIYLLPFFPRVMLAIPIGLIALFVFLLINFTSLKIVITNYEVDVSFGWFHHRIERSGILKVSKISARFGDVLGLGIRIGPHGENIWNIQFTDAVKIECRGQKRAFAFTSAHPDNIIAILKK